MCDCNFCDWDKEIQLKLGPNPDGSFPILSELDLEEVKTAMGKVARNRAPVVIPKGMTADDYQNMNILPGNRIGWQQKQEHLHNLSDLYTLGYLTEEEYEKRTEWVNNAQTIEQVNIVFTDLRKTLSAEAGSYLLLKPAPAKGDYWWAATWMFLTTGGLIAACIRLAMTHAWAAEWILIAGTMIITTAFALHNRK